MTVGFNYAWAYETYGGQIGPNPNVPWELWLDQQKLALAGKEKQIPLPDLFKNIDRNLDHLSQMGITVVRWFLLCNGFNYGLGGAKRNLAPQPSTNEFAWVDYVFDPPLRPDPRFAYHFEEMLKRFKKAGVQLIPSFIDFGWIADFNGSVDRAGSRTPGRKIDCITDPGKRLVLWQLLNEFLKVSRSYAAQIYAWEVCNEPAWWTSGYFPHATPAVWIVHRTGEPSNPFRAGALPKGVIKDFLIEGIQTIEAGGFKGKSTVGHRYFSDIAGADPYPTGSLPQFHYYGKPSDPDKIPTFGGDAVPFLGEFASDAADAERSQPWTKDLPGGNDTTYQRLKLLEQRGCQLALIWPDKSGYGPGKKQEDWVKLEEGTRRQIVQYTGGTFVPGEPAE